MTSPGVHSQVLIALKEDDVVFEISSMEEYERQAEISVTTIT